MVSNTELTCHDRVVLLLREIDPDLADVVTAVGPSTNGEVMVGLLGWLPLPERLRLGRAVLITHLEADCEHNAKPSSQLAKEMVANDAAWRDPQSPECRTRRDAGITTWTALGHPPPRL